MRWTTDTSSSRRAIAATLNHATRAIHPRPRRAARFAPFTAPTSHRSDQVQEQTAVVVGEIREVVREVGEVVTDADLEVVSHAAVDRQHGARPAVARIRQVEEAPLERALVVLQETPIGPQYVEVRVVAE